MFIEIFKKGLQRVYVVSQPREYTHVDSVAWGFGIC